MMVEMDSGGSGNKNPLHPHRKLYMKFLILHTYESSRMFRKCFTYKFYQHYRTMEHSQRSSRSFPECSIEGSF